MQCEVCETWCERLRFDVTNPPQSSYGGVSVDQWMRPESHVVRKDSSLLRSQGEGAAQTVLERIINAPSRVTGKWV